MEDVTTSWPHGLCRADGDTPNSVRQMPTVNDVMWEAELELLASLGC